MQKGNKKILMIGLTPPLEGGSERHIYEISSRIPESTVLTQKNSICKNKIEIPTIPKGGILRNISFLLSSLLYSIMLIMSFKKKYEIIHIHENLLYFLVPILRIRYEVIVTVHGITGFKFFDNKFLWFFFKNSLKFTSKIISVSIANKEHLDKEFNNVAYVPNGVNLEVYKKIENPKIQKRITFVGRIHEQKGVEFLVKAFEIVSKKYPEYKLKIIGKKEGKLYENLSKRNKKIVWKGFIIDRKVLFSELANSEILVFPSLWEALPWPALLEGVGSGRPVVASDLNGMRKVFEDNLNILLVKPRKAEEIASKIIQLINDKKMAKKIGLNGKKLVKNYTWDTLSKKIQNVYNKGITFQI